jgi:ABC-type Zn uptake system ZnuABC Zn-binding protein ZnuA
MSRKNNNFIFSIITLLFICSFSTLSAQGKLKVVSSASMFTDMTSNIAGDKIELKTLVPIGGDPHLYEPTPRDADIVNKADLILVNGLHFEGWILELIENSGTDAKVITITEGVTPIASSDYKNSYDPHAWMSAENGLTYIDNIKDALVIADPANSDFYISNHVKYAQELKELHSYIKTAIQKIPAAQRVLITSHDAFKYFGNTYGLKLEAIMGISTESEAQTSDIARVTKAIETYKVPAIFIESTINPKMLKQIAQDNNVSIGGELYADSLGDKNSEGSTYVKMLKHNTNVIVSALKDKVNTKSKHDDHDTKSSPWITYLSVSLALLAGFLIVMYKMNK